MLGSGFDLGKAHEIGQANEQQTDRKRERPNFRVRPFSCSGVQSHRVGPGGASRTGSRELEGSKAMNVF